MRDCIAEPLLVAQQILAQLGQDIIFRIHDPAHFDLCSVPGCRIEHRHFVLSVPTGLGLFITRASAYAGNRAFQVKVALLVLAGINVAWLHFITLPRLDRQSALPWARGAASVAGACSLVLWIGVIVAGRWIGYLP
jgi:hypothetical protein